MSFDFRIADPPSRWPSTYRPQYADAPEYFRVTIRGMQALRAALTVAGVLDVDARVPSFPPWPPPHADANRAAETATGESVQPPSTATEIATLEAWRNKRASALETSSDDPTKVPAFKFASNDAWRVNAEESRAIADALRRVLAERADALVAAMEQAGSASPREETLRWLESFAAYNDVAAAHGGYIVS